MNTLIHAPGVKQERGGCQVGMLGLWEVLSGKLLLLPGLWMRLALQCRNTPTSYSGSPFPASLPEN